MGICSRTITDTSSLLFMVAGSIVALLAASRLLHDSTTKPKDHDKINQKDGRSDKPRSPDDEDNNELPQHLQRELYKIERRRASASFLSMKKPAYDNIEMYGPDDVLLCTIGKKKAEWYVTKKNLAVWRNSTSKNNNKSSSPSIRLLFTPKSYQIKQQPLHDKTEHLLVGHHTLASTTKVYNQSHKRNICVACGSSQDLMRHYVVPYTYRRLLPQKFKSHLPHDIVLLCFHCHVCAGQASVEQRDLVYEPRYRIDPESARSVLPNRHLRHIKSCMEALLRHREQLPVKRIQEYEDVVKQYLLSTDGRDYNFNGEFTDAVPPSVLQDLVESLETDRPNPKYVSISELVVQSLQSDQEVANFIQSWRRLFVKTLQPRYLPVGWSVTSPVENDDSSNQTVCEGTTLLPCTLK